MMYVGLAIHSNHTQSHTHTHTHTRTHARTHARTHTHPFNGPLSGTTQVSPYQKGKTNLDFTEAKDSEWQWHQLGHVQVYTSLQTDSHASTPPLCFLQARCFSCRPTNSVKALKAVKQEPDDVCWFCYSTHIFNLSQQKQFMHILVNDCFSL